MKKKCQRCNEYFNPDDSDDYKVCQRCVDRHRDGLPPVQYRQLPEWEMRKLVESKKRNKPKKKPVGSGYEIHTCTICGQEFVATHKAQKICSYECRKERDRRYWHERYSKEKANANRGQNE